MARALKTWFCLSVVLLLAGCSRQKTFDAEELRSEVTKAASIAAEAESFFDYVVQGRATGSYAEGHAEYLGHEAMQSARTFDQAAAEPSIQQAFETSKQQVDSLAKELAAASAEITRPDLLEASKQRIAKIRAALRETKSSL